MSGLKTTWELPKTHSSQGYPLDYFQDFDILVLAGDINGTQYFLNGNTLTELSATSPGLNLYPALFDKRFQKLYASDGSSHIDTLRKLNKAALLKLEEFNLIGFENIEKLSLLNESDDLESIQLVQNILKTQYNVDL